MKISIVDFSTKKSFSVFLLLIALFPFQPVPSQAQLARNPVIFADVPDMSMIRVGNSYWIPIGSELKMEYSMPHFMGYRFGLFNYSTKKPGGYVDFDWFRVE